LHHFDPQGTAQVITNNMAGVVSNTHPSGVLRHPQGKAYSLQPQVSCDANGNLQELTPRCRSSETKQ
jgi:hypothetical protein